MKVVLVRVHLVRYKTSESGGVGHLLWTTFAVLSCTLCKNHHGKTLAEKFSDNEEETKE